MATTHNPTNFEPVDYEVEDYLDNKRPEFFGRSQQDAIDYRNEVEAWEASMERALGADWRAKSHRCIHCGNGTVRWITAVRHVPSNEVVVFGAVCTGRLGFADKFAFKLAQLQARAEARNVRFTIFTKRQEFLAAHPEVEAILTHIDQPQHAKNFFAQDVMRKLDQYGSLSQAQVDAVVKSLARDNEHEARKAAEAAEPKGDAPSGRQTVTGTVVSIKTQEGYMPGTTTLKMLVKLENNSKAWASVPSGADVQKGDTITFKATFEVSNVDKSFAFGKRPTLVKVTHNEQPDGSLPPVRAQRSEVQS